jgi:c(7)-type cytochrome triheme protein
MRYILSSLLVLSVSFGVLAQQKKQSAPKMTYESKFGAVVFDHEAHAKRVKDDCKVCHDKIWGETKGQVNFKGGAMHKEAETKKTSCAVCHHAGGQAFAVKANCQKCHAKPGAKKG